MKKKKVIKYSGGGDNIAAYYGYDPKVFATLPNKQQLIDDYFTKVKGMTYDAQLGGYKPSKIQPSIQPDTASISDMYEYSKKYGSTELPYEKWNTLDPFQKQDIYHKALLNSGAKQLGENKFQVIMKKGGKIKKADTGGMIGNLIGQATNFIPGVGPLFAPFASQLLSSLGSEIDKSDEVNSVKINEKNLANYTNNPYGSYKMGGKLMCKYGGKTSNGSVPSYLKSISGGKLKHLTEDVYLGVGNSHKDGGIKADTDFDGIQNLEFEGKELYVDNEKYIINKDISKPYTKLFKGIGERIDTVSKNSVNLAKKDMLEKNEINLQNKGKDSKFASGGPFSEDFLSKVLNNISQSTPYVAGFWNDINYPNSLTRDAERGNLRIGANKNYLSPTDVLQKEFVANTDQSSGLGLTTGDKLELFGNTVAPLVNIGRGLFGKVEKYNQNRYYNPNEDATLNNIDKLGELSYNSQPIQNQLDRVFAAGKEDINNSTSSASVRRANLQALYSNLGQKRSEIDLQGQQMNNQYKSSALSEKANALSNFGSQRIASKMATDQFNLQAEGAKDNLLTTGISQLGQGITNYGLFKNQNSQNNLQLGLLNELTTSYGFDIDAVKKLINAGFSKEDIIKYLGKN